jgi:hypothetical protein
VPEEEVWHEIKKKSDQQRQRKGQARYLSWILFCARVTTWTRLFSVTYTNCRIHGDYSRPGSYRFFADLSSNHALDRKLELVYDLTTDWPHLLRPLSHDEEKDNDDEGEETESLLPHRLLIVCSSSFSAHSRSFPSLQPSSLAGIPPSALALTLPLPTTPLISSTSSAPSPLSSSWRQRGRCMSERSGRYWMR